MLSVLFLLVILICNIQGQECDKECYQNVELRFRNLINSFNIPTNVTDVLKSYNTVKNFTRTVDNITTDIQTIEELIKQDLGDLNRRKLEHDKTIANCYQAKKSYKNLTTTLDRITERIKNLRTIYENTTDRINDSKEKNRQRKKVLDSLRIPDFIGDSYMCHTNFEDTVQKIISMGHRITKGFNDLKGNLLDGLEKKNEDNRKIIDGIENADKNVTDPPLKIDTETEPLLNKISTQIKDLQDRLNNITDIKPIDVSKHVAKNDEILKEFEKILKLIFSDENIRRVRHEIKKAEETIDILRTKSELKKEFEGVREVVNKLQISDSCKFVDIDPEP